MGRASNRLGALISVEQVGAGPRLDPNSGYAKINLLRPLLGNLASCKFSERLVVKLRKNDIQQVWAAAGIEPSSLRAENNGKFTLVGVSP